MQFFYALGLMILATIGLGVFLIFKPVKAKQVAKKIFFSTVTSFGILLVIAIISMLPAGGFAVPASTTTTASNTSATVSNGAGSAMIGVALATGLASMGAGIGVGMVGASAIGAISEKPEMLGKTLIYAGLAEGVAIYGIVVSIMILGRI
jgi:V/A-type H+-transporting ATPase subunit K